MEMFEDGGLKDEGGTIDPVSGNDVPPGSTQEEVRDDIPAQLSEGEFVFPADVTRFIGLEKLMMMRQEAKMGLKKMEDMGQMGNSEEATMSDDMPFNSTDIETDDDTPFSLEDLEMEDDSKEMAEGGYVMVEGKPMPIPMIGGQLPPITTRPMPETRNMAVGGLTNPTGTYQVPTDIATQPSYFQNYQQSTAPFRPFVPQNVGTQPPSNTVPVAGQVPTFGELMPQLTGKRETLEYRNDAGQKLFIPFINGKPIYPIPEGYTRYIAEEVTTPDKPTNVQSTSVRQDQQDGSDTGIETTRGMSIDKYGKGKTDNSQSVTEKTASVMDAVTQAKGASPLGRGLQTLGMAAMPFGLSQLTSSIGKPDPTALNSMIDQQQTAMGTYSGMTPGEIDQDPMGNLDAMSMAAYGMSLEDKAKELGMSPMGYAQVAFTYGYKNGQVDPSTNATYAYGQSTDDDGNVSYGSITDFSISMQAMGKTGFMGHLGNVDRVINSPTATKKQIDAAKRYKQIVTLKSKYGKDVDVDTLSGRSFGDDKGGTGPGPGDGGAPTGDPDDDDSASQGDTTATDTGVGAGVGMGSVSTEEANENEDGSNADTDNDGTGGGANTYKGSLITKRKASGKLKKKYMKRGGLASR